MNVPVMFTRVPITTPCPVKILPGTVGITTIDGDPVPIDERTEYCAVDAEWMIGAQRLCDVHCRELFELGWIDGSFDGLIRDTFGEYGEHGIAQARERMLRPWSERKRYSQDEAREWDS